MASVSIQARIDSDVWESIRTEGETNTQVLQRITAHYTATSTAKLTEIAPTPDAAIAVLLYSHQLLQQFAGGGMISASTAAPASVAVPEEEQEGFIAAQCADDF